MYTTLERALRKVTFYSRKMPRIACMNERILGIVVYSHELYFHGKQSRHSPLFSYSLLYLPLRVCRAKTYH